MANGGPMITPPRGEPVPERCLACERGRCVKCWGTWTDYSTGDSWFCDCTHETADQPGEAPEPDR